MADCVDLRKLLPDMNLVNVHFGLKKAKKNPIFYFSRSIQYPIYERSGNIMRRKNKNNL